MKVKTEVPVIFTGKFSFLASELIFTLSIDDLFSIAYFDSERGELTYECPCDVELKGFMDSVLKRKDIKVSRMPSKSRSLDGLECTNCYVAALASIYYSNPQGIYSLNELELPAHIKLALRQIFYGGLQSYVVESTKHALMDYFYPSGQFKMTVALSAIEGIDNFIFPSEAYLLFKLGMRYIYNSELESGIKHIVKSSMEIYEKNKEWLPSELSGLPFVPMGKNLLFITPSGHRCNQSISAITERIADLLRSKKLKAIIGRMSNGGTLISSQS